HPAREPPLTALTGGRRMQQMSTAMNFTLTRHAQDELERRSIPLGLLTAILEQPGQIVPEYGGKRAYQSQLDFGAGRIYLRWAIVADPTRHPEPAGSGGPQETKLLTDGPLKVGSRFESRQKAMGMPYTSQSEVTAWRRPACCAGASRTTPTGEGSREGSAP